MQIKRLADYAPIIDPNQCTVILNPNGSAAMDNLYLFCTPMSTAQHQAAITSLQNNATQLASYQSVVDVAMVNGDLARIAP